MKEKDFTTGKGGGLRFNGGKLRYDLVNPKAMEDFVGVLTDGANKYAERNWENGLTWTSVLASLKRHIAAFEAGEDYDGESGRLHMAHAACNVHFLNSYYYIFPQGDDRPKSFLRLPKIGLDIDGVLADFTGAWNKLYPEVSPTPNSWYFDAKINERIGEMKEDGTLNMFYFDIEPLIKSEDLPFEPHCYITTRPVDTKVTEMWLAEHEFPAKPVITVNEKDGKLKSAKEMGVEIFIDDSYENFVQLNNGGIFTYLYTNTWNERYGVGHMRLDCLKNIPFLK